MTRLMFVSSKNPYDPLASVGGAETAMRQIADHLSQLGHEVTYVSLKGSEESSQAANSSGVKLIFFPATLSRFRLLWISPIIFATLFWVVASRRIQSTYAFYELFGVVSSYFLGKYRPSMKVTIGIVGLSWKDAVEQPGWRRRVFKAAFARANSIHYQHEDLIPLTTTAGRNVGIDIQDKPFFVGDIGVPVNELLSTTYQRSNSSSGKTFVILVPTRFSRYQKRQDLIIEAVSLLPEDLRVEIRFAGDGAQEEAMKQLAKKLLDASRYSFLGFLPQAQLWDEMRSADVVALPTDYEGLGKIVLEAMALGTPVVVSDVVPLNSYIQDGQNGFLVSNFPESWAEVLGKIIDTAEALEEVAISARHFVTTNYSPDTNVAIFADNLT